MLHIDNKPLYDEATEFVTGTDPAIVADQEFRFLDYIFQNRYPL